MSAISQKSITGITSITTPAGVDNQLTLHVNDTSEALKLDHAGNIHIHNHVNTTGISSASNFKTGSSNLHSSGLSAASIDVGSNIKLGNAGIITATSYVGGLPITDGANNRIITASSPSAIQGEAGLTFDGTTLSNVGTGFKEIKIAPSTNNSATLRLQNSQANFTVSNITGGSFSIADGSDTRFTINSSGVVGINNDLDVDGHTNLDNVSIAGVSTFTGEVVAGSVISVQTGGSINIPDKLIHSGDPDTAIRFPSADTISFETAGSTRLHIHSDGRFRVGTTSQPSATVGGFQLDMGSYPGTARLSSGGGASGTTSASLGIYGSNHHASLENGSNAGASLNLYNYNTTDGNSTGVSYHNSNSLAIARILGLIVSHSSRTGALVFMTSNGSHPTEKVRIDSDGVLKIERGSASDTALEINTTSTTQACRIGFSESGTRKAEIAYSHDNNQIEVVGKSGQGASIFTNALERVRITSGGHINLEGNIIRTNNITSGGAHMYLRNNSQGANFSSHFQTFLSSNEAGTLQTHIHYYHGGYAELLHQGTSSIRTRSGGGVEFRNGNSTKIGTFSPDGLLFGTDTASANALDDYEEGSWTATMTGGNTITTNAAYYTKIGRMVYWMLHCTPTFAQNNTTDYQIYGLPFTSANVTQNYGWSGNITYTQNGNNSTLANMRPLVQMNDSYIYFHTVGLGDSSRIKNNFIRSTMLNQHFLLGGFYMAAY